MFADTAIQPPYVELLASKLMVWPLVPLNVKSPAWPGAVVVTVTGEPPIAIVPMSGAAS